MSEIGMERSRTHARSFRELVLERADGSCEACGTFSAYIAELHHIVAVVDGGVGGPGNLIALCANCHRFVTASIRYKRGPKAADVEACISRVYPTEIAEFLCHLANGCAEVDEQGNWRSWSLYAR